MEQSAVLSVFGKIPAGGRLFVGILVKGVTVAGYGDGMGKGAGGAS